MSAVGAVGLEDVERVKRVFYQSWRACTTSSPDDIAAPSTPDHDKLHQVTTLLLCCYKYVHFKKIFGMAFEPTGDSWLEH